MKRLIVVLKGYKTINNPFSFEKQGVVFTKRAPAIKNITLIYSTFFSTKIYILCNQKILKQQQTAVAF